tara:strand:+ start:335 stop:664 length:330 start_codon:yes stop_codon:yes gene_type:complete
MDDDVKEITVSDLSKKINDNDDFILIDVRTDDEYNFSNIKQAKHIPLDQLPQKFATLNKNKEYVLQCRSGGRSYKAAQIMKKNGFNKVYNLIGGLIDWSEKIDPSIEVD